MIKNKLVLFVLLSMFSLGVVASLVFIANFKQDNGLKSSTKSAEAITSVDELDDSLKGGAIYLEPNAEFTMRGGVIDGHSNTYGGAVYVSNGATFTMEGGTIESGSATNGGAIYVATGGTCIINGGTITECIASENGGAIYVENGGNLTINGSVITAGEEGTPEYSVVFSKNEAEISGGAIYMQDSTVENTLTLKNVTFSENQVKVHGGAVRVLGYMAIEGYNVSLIDNIIIEGSTKSVRGRGAGVYAEPKSTETEDMEKLTVNFRGYSYFCGNTIETCSPQPTGGAVCLFRGGSLLIEKGLISENKITQSVQADGTKVSGRGGAIFVYNYANLVLGVEGANKNSLIFEENQSSDTSGAIAAYYFSNVIIYSATITGNSSNLKGGGIYATESIVTLDKNVLVNNNYSVRGGGICLFKQTAALNINGATIDSNKLKNTPDDDRGYGANVYAEGAAINFNSGTISNGDAYDDSSEVYGGGIALTSSSENVSKLNIKAGEISDCKAVAGGAIYSSGAEITIDKLTINNCFATSDGGGIYSGYSTINIGVDGAANSSVVINQNNAYKTGGALAVYSDSVVNIYSATIQNNVSRNGGAIYASSSSVDLHENVLISLNTATLLGGGVRIYNGSTLTIVGAEISSNYVNKDDQGVCYGGGIEARGSTINFNSGAIMNNTTNNSSRLSGAGIALLGQNTVLNINSGTISDNVATVSGGGIFVYNGASVVFKAGTLTNNKTDTSSGRGGNVFVDIGSEFLMSGGTISGDGSTVQASFGGGIANLGVVNITGGKIQKCVAYAGGGIGNVGGVKLSSSYDLTSNQLSISNMSISNCVATSGIGPSIVTNNDISLNGSLDINGSIYMSATKQDELGVEHYPQIIVNDRLSAGESLDIKFCQGTYNVDSKLYSVSEETALMRTQYLGVADYSSESSFQAPAPLITYEKVSNLDLTDFVIYDYVKIDNNGKIYLYPAGITKVLTIQSYYGIIGSRLSTLEYEHKYPVLAGTECNFDVEANNNQINIGNSFVAEDYGGGIPYSILVDGEESSILDIVINEDLTVEYYYGVFEIPVLSDEFGDWQYLFVEYGGGFEVSSGRVYVNNPSERMSGDSGINLPYVYYRPSAYTYELVNSSEGTIVFGAGGSIYVEVGVLEDLSAGYELRVSGSIIDVDCPIMCTISLHGEWNYGSVLAFIARIEGGCSNKPTYVYRDGYVITIRTEYDSVSYVIPECEERLVVTVNGENLEDGASVAIDPSVDNISISVGCSTT